MIPLNEKQHLPKIAILYNSFRTLFVFIAVAGASLFQSFAGQGVDIKSVAMLAETLPPSSILVFVGCAGLYLLVLYLDWANRFFVFYEDSFSLHAGILKKTEKHIPYEKVQTVTQSATLIMRVLGLSSVSIETAAGAANTAINLRLLKRKQAELVVRQIEELRSFVKKSEVLGAAHLSEAEYKKENILDEIHEALSSSFRLDSKGLDLCDTKGVRGSKSCQETSSERRSLHLSNIELIGAGLDPKNLLRTGAWALMAFFGFLGSATPILLSLTHSFFGEAVAQEELAKLQQALNFFSGSNQRPLLQLIMAVLLVLACYVVAFFFMRMLASIINYAGFVIVRDEKSLSVECGLFSRYRMQIPLEKIQSVEIYEPFLLEKLGYCQLRLAKIDSAEEKSQGKGSETLSSRGSLLLHPCLKRSNLNSFVHDFLPEYSSYLESNQSKDAETVVLTLSAQAFRRAFIREYVLYSGMFWLMLTTVISVVVINVGQEFFLSQRIFDAASISFVLTALASVFCILTTLYIVVVPFIIYDKHLLRKDSLVCLERQGMRTTKGGLSRSTCLIDRTKMQCVQIRSNIFQQNQKIASLRIKSAQSFKGGKIDIVDVRILDARKTLQWFERGRNDKRGFEQQC